MSKIFRAHVAVFIANLIYGVNFSLAKEIMPKYIHAFGFIVIRVFIACGMFWLVGAIFGNEKVERKDLFLFLKFGIFGVAINQLLFFKGLDLTVPINAALIMTTNPIQVMVIAAIIFSDKISLTKIAGIVLGIAGAATIILAGKNFSLSSEHSRGDLFIFINSLSYAYFLVIAKPMLVKYKPITIMKWMFLFGAICVLPFGYSEFRQIEWCTMPTIIVWGVVFVVVGTTFLAYLLNIYGLQNLSSSTVSTYIYTQPFFATLFSIVFGQGHPQWIHLVSTVLIFSGVYLSSKNKPTLSPIVK